jgi:hypothetical protein
MPLSSLRTMTSTLRQIAATAMILSVAACAEGPTAPVTRSATGGVDFSLIGTLVRGTGDTTVTTFTVDPTTSTTFQVGSGHIVYFPRYSICDLTSSYGPSEWDKPCQPADSAVEITAKTWIDAAGQPQVDFSPAMRFTSVSQQNGESVGSSGDVVTIALAIDTLTAATAGERLAILYCATAASTCVDESLTDASLKTTTSLAHGYATRRIKHFSGYNISSGRVAETIELLLSRSANGNGRSIERTGHLMSSGRKE